MTNKDSHTDKSDFPPSGRYQIQRLLGMGGMGEVYQAWDPQLQRLVALKYLKSKLNNEMRIRTRFIREARALAKVSHPRIVKVFEVIDDKESTFFVQEYLKGRDLEWVIEDRVLLNVEEMKKILIELAEALSTLHENGLVHRDLKPSNLFIDDDRGLCLLDFGLVLDEEKTRLTQDNTIVGTLSYMSPEMVNGDEVTSRSDIFQVGLIAHVLLTGKNIDRPSMCDWGDLISVASLTIPTPKPAPDCPDELRELVIKCCSKKPCDRFKDGKELLDYLTRNKGKLTKVEKCIEKVPDEEKLDESIGTGPVSTSTLTKPLALRRVKLLAALISCFILCLLYFGLVANESPCSISALAINATPDGAVVTYGSGRKIPSRIEIAPRVKNEWLEFSSADKSYTSSHEIMVTSLKENSDYRLRVILPGGKRSLTQSFKTKRLKLLDFQIVRNNRLVARWQLSHGTTSSIFLGKDDLLPATRMGNIWQVELPDKALELKDFTVQTKLITGSSFDLSVADWYRETHKNFFTRAPLGVFRLDDAIKVFGRGLEDDLTATLDKQARLKALRSEFKKFMDDKELLVSFNKLENYLPLIYGTQIVSLAHQKRVYECLVELTRLFIYANDFRFDDLVQVPEWPYLNSFALELLPKGENWQIQKIHGDDERPIRLGNVIIAGPLTTWKKRFSLGKGFKAKDYAIDLRTGSFRDRMVRMKINGHTFYIFHEPIFPWTKARPIHFRQHIPKQCLMESLNTMELSVEGPYARRENSGIVNIDSVSLAYRHH